MCPLLNDFAYGQVSSPRLYWLNDYRLLLNIQDVFFKILKASATLSSEWRYKIEGVQIGPVQDLEKSKEGAIRAPQVPWTLPSPDEGRQKTFIFGEVVSAHGFEYDHVSIILKNSSNAQVGFKA